MSMLQISVPPSGLDKPPQTSKTLRRIIADPGKTVFWSAANSIPTFMVLRQSSSLFRIVRSAPIAMKKTFALFILHNSLISNARSRYLLSFPLVWCLPFCYKGMSLWKNMFLKAITFLLVLEPRNSMLPLTALKEWRQTFWTRITNAVLPIAVLRTCRLIVGKIICSKMKKTRLFSSNGVIK